MKPPSVKKNEFQNAQKEEEAELIKALGLESLLNEPVPSSQSSSGGHGIMLAGGMGAVFLAANLVMLFSLPPVLRGRGAPYLPTSRKSMDAMFAQLRKEHAGATAAKQPHNNNLCFVDLGSGDGRLVFRAAQEGIFAQSIGYEINPWLHAWAQSRRLVGGPSLWRRTSFGRCDLWNVDLRNADVVAVYGLSPIMEKLGVKLKDELRPGSYVVSNVFAIPGWTPQGSRAGTHIYKVPDSWQTSAKKT